MNTNTLINSSAVRKHALFAIQELRPHLSGKITRVSGDFLTRANAVLSNWIVDQVKSCPSAGKTLR